MIKVTYFWADWCGPCSTQSETVESLQELYESDDAVLIRKIDVDEKIGVANEYSIRSVPSIVVEQDDEVQTVFQGLTNEQELIEAIEDAK